MGFHPRSEFGLRALGAAEMETNGNPRDRHAKSLGITVRGHPLDHLLCHAVLPYSNWEWAARCQSESMLSLRHGLQEALHQLGWVTEIPRMRQLSESGFV